MKKIAIAALALAAATGIALAEVTSANTVGFTTKTVNADTFYLFGIQFEEVGTGTGAIKLGDLVTLSGIEASTYDDMEKEAAQIQVRNAANTAYNLYYYISDAYDSEGDEVEGWADANGDLADGAINIGKGFWFKVPAASVSGTATLKLKGQVNGGATGTVAFTANTFSLASNPFPVATDFSSVTVTGIQPSNYDNMEKNAAQIQVRNAANTAYNLYYYISDAYDSEGDEVEGWSDANGDLVEGDAIPVGAGFWIKSPTSGTVTFSL